MNSLQITYLSMGICYMAMGFIMCAINLIILFTVYIPAMKALKGAAGRYIERNPYEYHSERF